MFANHQFSTTPIDVPLLPPDDHDPFFFKDLERGGAAIGDPSQGINGNQWEFFIEENKRIYCRIIDTTRKFLVTSNTNITELVGTFDRNMNPVLVYRNDGIYYFYWFDTSVNRYQTETLPADVSSPRLTHDDKRAEAITYSDVIITYIQVDKLIYRLQRDRFTIDYIAKEKYVKNREIIRFGMNESLRLEWVLAQATKYRTDF